MKHLLPARYMLTMLLACFMALGAQAQTTVPPLEYFVSAKTGNDSRNGTSWNNAFKTVKAALQAVESNANVQAKIYLAEGEYDVGQKNAISYQKQGFSSDAFYVLTKSGQKLWLMGGYPTPGSQTLPKDTCNSNPKRHVTKFVSNVEMTSSVFRTFNDNQALIMHGITLDSKNFVGGTSDAALITFEKEGITSTCYNPYLEMIDCSIGYYKSLQSGVIFFYGDMNNPKVKIERCEVLQGDKGLVNGGGFLIFSIAHNQKNVQIDMKHVTFHDIRHQGTTEKFALLGASNAQPDNGTEDNSYVHLDHIQVNRNLGGMAAQQITTFYIQSFKDVKVTNSIFRNTTAGLGGAFRVLSCRNVLFENNQFYNCASGDAGGAVSVQRGASAYIPDGIGRRTIKFINNDFEANFCRNAGGALHVQY